MYLSIIFTLSLSFFLCNWAIEAALACFLISQWKLSWIAIRGFPLNLQLALAISSCRLFTLFRQQTKPSVPVPTWRRLRAAATDWDAFACPCTKSRARTRTNTCTHRVASHTQSWLTFRELPHTLRHLQHSFLFAKKSENKYQLSNNPKLEEMCVCVLAIWTVCPCMYMYVCVFSPKRQLLRRTQRLRRARQNVSLFAFVAEHWLSVWLSVSVCVPVCVCCSSEISAYHVNRRNTRNCFAWLLDAAPESMSHLFLFAVARNSARWCRPSGAPDGRTDGRTFP